MIVVCGEALIDMRSSDGIAYEAKLGGGPFNTAIAAGRLGAPVALLSRLSTDRFGRRFHQALHDSGVDTSLLRSGPEPTAVAIVDIDERGDASYTFHVTGTADRMISVADLPVLSGDVRVVHFGTLSLVLEPGATAYDELMQRCALDRLVVVDPNVRPLLIRDHAAYLDRFEHWCTLASAIKLSAADAAWLYPHQALELVGERLLELGTSLVALTDGARGALALSARLGIVRVGAASVPVVDTIGAGDTFNAAMMVWLHEHEVASRVHVAAMDSGEVEDLLRFASGAAAFTCSRAGAEPPWRDELSGATSTRRRGAR